MLACKVAESKNTNDQTLFFPDFCYPYAWYYYLLIAETSKKDLDEGREHSFFLALHNKGFQVLVYLHLLMEISHSHHYHMTQSAK